MAQSLDAPVKFRNTRATSDKMIEQRYCLIRVISCRRRRLVPSSPGRGRTTNPHRPESRNRDNDYNPYDSGRRADFPVLESVHYCTSIARHSGRLSCCSVAERNLLYPRVACGNRLFLT